MHEDKNWQKRIISCLLALSMLVRQVPATAFAAQTTVDAATTAQNVNLVQIYAEQIRYANERDSYLDVSGNTLTWNQEGETDT